MVDLDQELEVDVVVDAEVVVIDAKQQIVGVDDLFIGEVECFDLIECGNEVGQIGWCDWSRFEVELGVRSTDCWWQVFWIVEDLFGVDVLC